MLSFAAGIVDRTGGLRVVVTRHRRHFRSHVLPGERLFIVPDFKIEEPVPWPQIPGLIERVQKYVQEQITPANDCGGCALCCTIHYIEDKDFQGRDFIKPSGQTCQHCASGFGCKLYNQRPRSCRTFKCEWLASQTRNDVMPPELRPDKCGCYFTRDSFDRDPSLIEVHGEPNADAWRWIDEMQRLGYKAKKIISYGGEKT